MKKKAILLEIGLLIPFLVTIINYRLSVDLINGTLIFLGIDISESHLTIGEWLLVAYIFLLPIFQLLLFAFPRSIVDLSLREKSSLWLGTLFTSVGAWHMYSENIIFIG